MGTYSNGINGPFSGRVGAVVGVYWRGKNVVRSRPKKRTAPLTPNELKHRAKFALVNKFLKGVMDLVNYTYHPEIAYQTGFNKAFSYNLKNAVTAMDDKPAIDYSMVLLSKGDLPEPDSLNVDANTAGKIIFTWNDNSGRGQALSSDLAFIAFYSEEKNDWLYMKKLAERSQQTYQFNLSAYWTGLVLQTYFGFVSADGLESCDSLYAGAFILNK